jgi:hypothetical protein
VRTLDPDLEDCLRRANPYVETYAEVSTPDSGNVLRRPDQFNAPIGGTPAPAGGLIVGANGELKITPTVVALATFPGAQTWFDLNGENEELRRKGISWTVDKAFVRGVLRNFTAAVKRLPVLGIFYLDLDFQLQVFRITRTPGTRELLVRGAVQITPYTQYVFTPILSSPAVIKAASIAWGAPNAGDGNSEAATLNFDLSAYNVVLENTPGDATRPEYSGELPEYHFVISPIKHPKGTGYFRWLCDNATSRDVANIGHFERVFWARNTADEQWVRAAQGDVPQATINVENYAGTSLAQWALDMGKVPSALATGRVVFERTLPPGAVATIELSTDGGVNWAFFKHGDPIVTVQQTYRARVSLTAGSGGRSSPGVRAFGIEFRTPVDVSAECSVSWPTREIAVPWLASSIPEGKLKVVRTGSRDYDDPASQLGAKYPTPRLEVDVWLRSKHPAVTRDKWLRLERLTVTNRSPTATAEEFSLLSYLSRLKKKIPEKRESVSSTHTVQAGSTAAQLIVAPNLPGVTAGGNELDNKHYYIRVPSTAKVEFIDGFVQEVAGNTNVNKLDFAPALPAILNTGDVIELHSGVFGTAAVTWQDADPADVWYQLFTTYAGVPPERIGHGSLPRGGLPPRVTDRAPGDATTQAKCKITFAAREDEPVDELADQVSFICGGATIEVDGQLCYVQIYPLFDATGVISVPLPPISRTFDPRDVSIPATSPALESRTTVVTGIYGVNKAATNPDAYPERLTVGVDVDAVAWLTQQSIEDIGNSELPEKIGRWLYNSTDFGLYLATQVIAQVVRAGSTGLRVFGFTSVDAFPEHTPGDVVVLVTDQYTDYDPATARELRGWLAVKGVLVKVGKGGHDFGMYVLGLADNVTTLKGLAPGSNAGVGEPPGFPLIVGDFNSSGQATISVFAGSGTVSAKIAVSTVATPLDATVEATSPINGDIFSVLFTSPIVPPGGTLFIKLFEYTELDGGGVRSAPFVIQFQRPTGDTAQPPTADFQEIAESQTAMTFRLTGGAGVGGVGPLQYRFRTDFNGATGAFSAWAAFPSGGGTYIDIVTSKANFYPKKLVAQTRDASPTPVESALVTADIMGRFESHAPTTGRLDPIVPTNTGFNVFQYGSDTPAGVVPSASQTFIAPTMVDASFRVVNVYRAAAVEPAGNLFKRGSDVASDVVTTSTRTFVDPGASVQVDGSGHIVGVYRLGVIEPVNNLVKFGDSLGATVMTSLTLNGAVIDVLTLSGSPTVGKQIALGDSSVAPRIGTMFSSAAIFMAYNATQTYNTDLWTQPLISLGSAVLELSSSGLVYWNAPAGRTAGTKSAFWTSLPVFQVTSGGELLLWSNGIYHSINLIAGVGTANVGIMFTNTGGRYFIGVDSSVGTQVGAGVYAMYIWTESARDIVIGHNNIVRAKFTALGFSLKGNLYFDYNYENGLVGLYDPTKFRGLYAIGDAYRMPVGGTTLAGAGPGGNNFYGLFFAYDALVSYQNITGHGLGHGVGVASNGVAVAYMGAGFWTSGSIYAAELNSNARKLLGDWYVDDGANTARQIAKIIISGAAPASETAPAGTIWIRT